MKVKELIEALKTLDGDTEIEYSNDEGSGFRIERIVTVYRVYSGESYYLIE